MPHTWIDTAHHTSILDLTGNKFVLAVAERADEWRKQLDPYGVVVRQVDPLILSQDASAALIRPDGYVAWIPDTPNMDPESVLGAISQVLGHTAHSGR
jgi:hypothetical protein